MAKSGNLGVIDRLESKGNDGEPPLIESAKMEEKYRTGLLQTGSGRFVHPKYYDGMEEIESRFSSFFDENKIRLSNCFGFVYITGDSKRRAYMSTYDIQKYINDIPEEIKQEARKFIEELKKWVYDQNYRY